MRQRLLCVLLVVLTATPAALSHGSDTHPPGTVEPIDAPDPETMPPVGGYTGPGPEPYLSFFEGAWLYGSASATPLGDQVPRNLRGFGDWLVWEDASRGDIYAYNIPAGSGYYVTADAALQRNPAIHGDVVVWEDHRHGRADVYAYFLDTAETRRLSVGPGNHRAPSIEGSLVAWEDDRNGTRDIWASYLDGSPEFPVHEGPDRESDPLVRDGVVYYRTYRFNVWDIAARDVARNESFEITADIGIQGAPFTNGDDVFFLSQYVGSSWTLTRYDPRRDRAVDTGLKFQDSTMTPVHEDRLIMMARDLNGAVQLVARNITSGDNNHVSGNLRPTTEPHIWEGTVYVAVQARNGTSLLALEVSPFAFGKRPSLTITSPGAVAPWLRAINIQGILSTGPGWTEPTTFTATVDDAPPQIVPAGERWRVTLDPAGFAPGNHFVTIRATFREGPPVTAGLTLVVPAATADIDVAAAGPAYHAQRALATFDQYIGSNPAAWLILPLLLVLIVLLLVRIVYFFKGRRRVVTAEYVPPE